MTYSDTILADSPSAYWHLGDAGSTAVDAVGAASPGAYVASPTHTTGIPGYSTDNSLVLVAASSQCVTVAHTTALTLSDAGFTIEAWVKRSANTGTYGIYSANSGASYLRLNSTNSVECLSSGTSLILTSTVTIANDGSWHHVVWTKAGATNVLYIDGVVRTGAVTNATLTDTGSIISIGADFQGTGDFYDGGLDEVAIYKSVLSPTTVAAHYTAGITIPIQTSHVTSIVANASTWTDQAGSSVSANLVTALDDNTATYIKSPGNPAGSGPITIHTGALSKPNAGNRNFVVGLQKSANTGTMDYTVECKKSGGVSVQTFNKDGSAGATLVAALGNVASTGATATCTVTNAIADGDWANGFDWVVTPLKSA